MGWACGLMALSFRKRKRQRKEKQERPDTGQDVALTRALFLERKAPAEKKFKSGED